MFLKKLIDCIKKYPWRSYFATTGSLGFGYGFKTRMDSDLKTMRLCTTSSHQDYVDVGINATLSGIVYISVFMASPVVVPVVGIWGFAIPKTLKSYNDKKIRNQEIKGKNLIGY